MTDQRHQPSINEIIQTVLDDGLSLDLRPPDVALLVLILHQTEKRFYEMYSATAETPMAAEPTIDAYQHNNKEHLMNYGVDISTLTRMIEDGEL